MTQLETVTVPTWTTGWRMQRALAHAGISVEQMAQELGVSRSTVSRWLNDRGTPSRGYLTLWAQRTGVPYEWLNEERTLVPPTALTPQPPGWFADLAAVHVQLHNPLHMLAHGPVTVSGDRELTGREILDLKHQLRGDIRRGTTRLTGSRHPVAAQGDHHHAQ